MVNAYFFFFFSTRRKEGGKNGKSHVSFLKLITFSNKQALNTKKSKREEERVHSPQKREESGEKSHIVPGCQF